MTAHIKVNADAATLDRTVLHDLLRTELAFEGAIVADALEMKGVSARHDVADAAVLAVEAGADALIVGHDLGEHDTRASSPRSTSACRRIASKRQAHASRSSRGGLGRARRRSIARRRWVRRSGRFAPKETSRSPAIRSSSSCGRRRTSPPARRSTRLATRVVREGEPIPDADVYVVRDVHRHPWMEAADRPGAVVVEIGLPVWQPSAARGYVSSLGGGRASLDAVEAVLSSPVRL